MTLALVMMATIGTASVEDQPDDTVDTNGSVYDIAVVGGTIYIVGDFTQVGDVPRNNAAAIDAATGRATAWNPDVDAPVHAVAAAPDGSLYLGGEFSRVGGQRRAKLAHVDAGGAVRTWNPSASSGRVQALAVHGGRVYVGGRFTQVNGQPRQHLAALGAVDARLVDAWRPDADREVWDIEVDGAGDVWIAGWFRRVANRQREGIAEVTAGGAVTGFDASMDRSAYDLALSPDGRRVYVAAAGGGGRVISYAMDTSSGAELWHAQTDGDMQAVDATSTEVYAGGHQDLVDGKPRSQLAAFDAASGDLLPWNPSAFGGKGPRVIVISQHGLLVGGEFSRVAGEPHQGFVRFRTEGGSPDPTPSPTPSPTPTPTPTPSPSPTPTPSPTASPSPSPSPTASTPPPPSPSPTPTTPPDGPALPFEGLQRLSGTDRTATATAISQAFFTAPVDEVVVATAEDFPDALAGGPLAARRGAPMLLTQGGELPAVVVAELQRLQPERVTVLGGPRAVPPAVAEQLEGLTSTGVVTRLAGSDRFATAAEIASQLATQPGGTVYMATGLGFADALAGGPLATDGPLLLVATDHVPPATADRLMALRPDRVVILGGPAAVSQTVVDQVTALTGTVPSRLAGPDRYDTAVEIAGRFEAGARLVLVATGQAFPDALAGGAVAPHFGAPILLVASDRVPDAVADQLRRLAPAAIAVVGGPNAVSEDVVAELHDLMP